MATLFGMFPFLQKLFADGGYQGPEFSTALAKVCPHLNVEIVKRSDRAGAKTEAGSGTGWSWSKIVGLASPLVKTPKMAEPLVKMSGFPRVAEGLGYHRHGVTVLGKAVRGALDLSDAVGADDGGHLGGGRRKADGIGEVAEDGDQTCGSQLRGRGVGPRQGQDLMSLLRQLSGDGGPDKSGRARDKDLHGASISQSDADSRLASLGLAGIAARPAGNAAFDPGGDCGADVSRGPFNFWKMAKRDRASRSGHGEGAARADQKKFVEDLDSGFEARSEAS